MFIGRRVLSALNQVSQRLAIASQVPLSPQKWTQYSSNSKSGRRGSHLSPSNRTQELYIAYDQDW